ncbi:MAG: BrnT family toxin [Lachnospiraceae bacterium]|nr:BrnT family toxin [Lachnospiraceae bacterium]
MGIGIDDPDHSEDEDRFIILGESNKANLLVVCHCYRVSDTVIRIISVCLPNKNEIVFCEDVNCHMCQVENMCDGRIF